MLTSTCAVCQTLTGDWKPLEEKAIGLYLAGRYDRAKVYFEQAIENYSQEDSLLAGLYLNLGNSVYYISKDRKQHVKDAIVWYEKALEIRLREPDTLKQSIATLMNYLGYCYNEIGDLEAQISYNMRELYLKSKLYDRNPSPQSAYDLATAHNNLGIAWSEWGYITPYIDHSLQAFQVMNAYQESLASYIPQFAHNLASAYWYASDMENFLRYEKLALHGALKMRPDSASNGVAQSLNGLSSYFLHYKKEYEKAYKYILLTHQAIEKAEDIVQTRFKLTVYENLAVASMKLQKFNQAKAWLDIASDFVEQQYGKDHRFGLSTVRGQGLLQIHLNQFEQALATNQSGLLVANSLYAQDHPIVLSFQTSIANIYLKQKEWQKAHAVLAGIIALFPTDSLEDAEPTRIGASAKIDYFHLVSAMLLQMEAYHLEYLAEGKEAPLLAAIALTERLMPYLASIRKGYKQEEQKLELQSRLKNVSNLFLEMVYELGQTEDENPYLDQAYNFVQQVRANVLQDHLSGLTAQQQAGIPQALQVRESELNAHILYLRKRLEALTQDQAEIYRKTLDQLLKAEASMDSLIHAFESEYPSYYRWKYKKAKGSLADIQKKLLGRKTAMLEYHRGDSVLFIVALDRSQRKFLRIAVNEALEKELADLIEQLRNKTRIRDSIGNMELFKRYQRTAYGIYQQIVAPALAALGGEYEELLIVPDGQLYYLPFEALLQEPYQDISDQPAYGMLPYLVKKYSIRYAYASRLLLRGEELSRNYKREYVGFVPSYKNVKQAEIQNYWERLGTCYSRVTNANILPDFKVFIENSVQEWQGMAFVDAGATEGVFKLNAGNSKILHLGMHGLLCEEKPEQSGLLFDSPEYLTEWLDSLEQDFWFAPDSIEDGFLHLYEIYSLKILSDLVILSACHTGEGELAHGEGVLSLARAFRYAGSENLIMSVWEAEEQVMLQMLSSYLRRLKKGGGKSLALTEAKRLYLESEKGVKGHPHFWANMVLNGDDKPVFNSYLGWRLMGILAILASLICTVLWLRNIRNKRDLLRS